MIVQPVVEPMDSFTALILNYYEQGREDEERVLISDGKYFCIITEIFSQVGW